jgi:hypothetical protein
MLRNSRTLRLDWLRAAQTYYLSPGDDTGMSDREWDAAAMLLFDNRDVFPLCPVLNDPEYRGGSLFWVKKKMYEQALAQE